MKKSISCGVIITDGSRLILGHVTQGAHWDIPKGGMNEGETFVQTAVRELKEETGLGLSEQQLQPLGRFDYKPKKDLELFLWQTPNLPDPASLKCSSTWQDKRGRSLPELDRFRISTWEDAMSRVNTDLSRILKKIKESLS